MILKQCENEQKKILLSNVRYAFSKFDWKRQCRRHKYEWNWAINNNEIINSFFLNVNRRVHEIYNDDVEMLVVFIKNYCKF